MKVKLKKRNIKILTLTLVLFFMLVYLLTRTRSTALEDMELRSVVVKGAPGSEIYDEARSDEFDDDKEYKDPFIDQLIKEKRVYNKAAGQYCLEKRNFVFIKTMKCATQTMVQILRRFGYRRHLNFVLPREENIYLGWPFILDPVDYRPSKYPYNALTEHSVYNDTVMKKLLPRGTDYITIIREPFSQFKSGFNYFNVANISKVTQDGRDVLTEYLRNIENYDAFYRNPEASAIRYCIPDGFSVTKNIMSHCLGMPLGFPNTRDDITADKGLVQAYIEKLDKEFTLVMIMEYFHESLVLLKHLMCWTLEDILYHTSNVANYAYKYRKPDPKNVDIYKKWSHVDYILYDHFNKTFWRKIEQQRADFHAEVLAYTNMQARVSKYCDDLHTHRNSPMVIEASVFHDKIVVDKTYCLLMGVDLLAFLKARFDHEEGWMEDGEPTKTKRGC